MKWSREILRRLPALACLGVLAAPAYADTDISLRVKDHRFVPDEISAPPGEKLRLTVKNEDTGPFEFESVDLHREKIVLPGREITIVVGPLHAGTFEFFDDFHHDTHGRLTVK